MQLNSISDTIRTLDRRPFLDRFLMLHGNKDRLRPSEDNPLDLTDSSESDGSPGKGVAPLE